MIEGKIAKYEMWWNIELLHALGIGKHALNTEISHGHALSVWTDLGPGKRNGRYIVVATAAPARQQRWKTYLASPAKWLPEEASPRFLVQSNALIIFPLGRTSMQKLQPLLSPCNATTTTTASQATVTTAERQQKCIGRESNPGLAETGPIDGLATANFTTKPPMREMKGGDHVIDERASPHSSYEVRYIPLGRGLDDFTVLKGEWFLRFSV